MKSVKSVKFGVPEIYLVKKIPITNGKEYRLAVGKV